MALDPDKIPQLLADLRAVDDDTLVKLVAHLGDIAEQAIENVRTVNEDRLAAMNAAIQAASRVRQLRLDLRSASAELARRTVA